MRCKILLGMEMALTPFAGRRVWADEKHQNGHEADYNERDNEGDPPCCMCRKTMIHDERVEDGWHEEVGDSPSSIAPSSGKGIGGANHVLVKEARRPHLAWDEAASKDAHEEAKGDKTGRTEDRSGKGCRDSTSE